MSPVVLANPVDGDHIYVSAPLIVRNTKLPVSIDADEGVIVSVGKGLIVVIVVFVFTHPFEFVPVTVYVVATVGLAVTVAPVVALKAVEGAQIYVLAPLAVREVELPLHIVAEDGDMVKVGKGLTVTIIV